MNSWSSIVLLLLQAYQLIEFVIKYLSRKQWISRFNSCTFRFAQKCWPDIRIQHILGFVYIQGAVSASNFIATLISFMFQRFKRLGLLCSGCHPKPNLLDDKLVFEQPKIWKLRHPLCILHAPLDPGLFVTISSVYQRKRFNQCPLISEFLESEACVHLILLRAFSTTLDEISPLQFFLQNLIFSQIIEKFLVGFNYCVLRIQLWKYIF